MIDTLKFMDDLKEIKLMVEDQQPRYTIVDTIDDKIREGKIRVDKKIGEDIGFVTKAGWKMIDREGVICRA